MINRNKIIDCIINQIQKENQYLNECANILYNNGVVVIDLNLNKEDHDFLYDHNWLEEIKNIQQRDFKTKNPEYGFVLGAFGALGNPASFHSFLIYKLRYILFKKLSKIFSNLDSNKNLECLFDRIAIRRENTDISAESFHRDTCSLRGEQDVIYGGWINLDLSENQYFSCVPGTHTCTGKGGFERIDGNFNSRKVKYTIKPKQVIIFDQNLIHEIFKQRIKKTNIRLYLGWRHTISSIPLFNSKKDNQYNITEIIKKQLVPPLPSGDLPYMYTKNHPRLFKSRIETLTSEIRDFYKEYNNKYKNNRVVKRSLKEPINIVDIPNDFKIIYYPNKLFY